MSTVNDCAALYAKIWNDLASGDWRTKSYEYDGRKVEFVTLKEAMDFLDRVKLEMQSTADFPLRTTAGGLER